VRTYQIFVTKKGGGDFVNPSDSALSEKLPQFITRFIGDRSTVKNLAELEMNWKLLEKSNDGTGNSRGIISYGRYGYAASLQDAKTGKENYKRKRSDSEVIELYYRIWSPDKERFAVAAFSSFSGKSCITLVFEDMKSEFEKRNSGYLLKYRKLMPSGASAKIYAGRPVKNLRLVTMKPPNDLADSLFRGKSQKTSKMSITIYSSRNNKLGDFTDLIEGLPADSSGVIQYDGIEFDQAVAMVKIGDGVHPVGVFGAHSDVGVVDITEDVVKDADGLPTYESVNKEASRILEAVYKTIHGQKS
jgi:hypothetical protein